MKVGEGETGCSLTLSCELPVSPTLSAFVLVSLSFVQSKYLGSMSRNGQSVWSRVGIGVY